MKTNYTARNFKMKCWTFYIFGNFLNFLFRRITNMNFSTITTTIILLPFVRDNPGEPVPEETHTHPPSWSSSNLYQLLPSTTIHMQVLYCKRKLDSYERIRCMTWSRCTHRMFSHRKDWFQWSSASCWHSHSTTATLSSQRYACTSEKYPPTTSGFRLVGV